MPPVESRCERSCSGTSRAAWSGLATRSRRYTTKVGTVASRRPAGPCPRARSSSGTTAPAAPSPARSGTGMGGESTSCCLPGSRVTPVTGTVWWPRRPARRPGRSPPARRPAPAPLRALRSPARVLGVVGVEPADPLGGPPRQGVRDQVEQPPLVGKGHPPSGVAEAEPGGLLHLVVVPGQVAADRPHQEVVDELVVARLLRCPNEPVVDGVERPDQLHLEAGLLAHLSQGSLWNRLTRLLLALRQGPLQRPLGRAAGDQGDAGVRPQLGEHHAAGRDGPGGAHRLAGQGPRPALARHGGPASSRRPPAQLSEGHRPPW